MGGNTGREPCLRAVLHPTSPAAFQICLNAPGMSAEHPAWSALGGRRGRCSQGHPAGIGIC